MVPTTKLLVIMFTFLFSFIITASIATATISLENDQTGQSVSPMDLEFLNAHNKVRLHAREPPLVWDEGLAQYASGYANKRAADCLLEHSNGPYGENICIWGEPNFTPKKVVREWVREHKHYNRKTNECEPGKVCGHYTQVVWKNTLRVGCGFAVCQNDMRAFIVCSYDPSGNYVGENPFGNEKPSN